MLRTGSQSGVHLETLMPANRVQHKDLLFLFVDGDDAMQLGQIKEIYLANSKAANRSRVGSQLKSSSRQRRAGRILTWLSNGTILSCSVLAAGFLVVEKYKFQ